MPCILLAEPDGPTRNFMVMKLKEAGHEVDAAENGQELIVLLSFRRHDLVISDLEMIGKNGLEALREIRRHPEYMSMPFVLFTRADPRLKTDNQHYDNLTCACWTDTGRPTVTGPLGSRRKTAGGGHDSWRSR